MKPCIKNSKYKMWIGFPDTRSNIIRYSFPVNDKRGAEFQFNYMYRNLLQKQLNHSYSCAYFIDVKSDRKIKKIENGGKVTDL